MTVVLVVFVAAALVASALVMVVLWVEDRAIERACDRFDFDADEDCGWWVGPVWKEGGEKCVCIEPRGHRLPHRCSCGAWFEGCGHERVTP